MSVNIIRMHHALFSQLSSTNLDPALLEQVRVLLIEKETKIKALTLELAYYKRIRYGKTSEVFQGEQRELFEETISADLAAIEAELEPDPNKVHHVRAAVRVARLCHLNYPGLNIVTNWNLANARLAERR